MTPTPIIIFICICRNFAIFSSRWLWFLNLEAVSFRSPLLLSMSNIYYLLSTILLKLSLMIPVTLSRVLIAWLVLSELPLPLCCRNLPCISWISILYHFRSTLSPFLHSRGHGEARSSSHRVLIGSISRTESIVSPHSRGWWLLRKWSNFCHRMNATKNLPAQISFAYCRWSLLSLTF